jgi:carbon-monoxide dehydrogenase small subunit
MRITFSLNGEIMTQDVKINKRLVDFLHDDLELYSIRPACYCGFCGACTILLDDKAVLSCLLPAFAIQGKRIVTLEGFENTEDYHIIYEALRKQNYIPCTQCFSAKVLTIQGLLINNYKPTEDEILEAITGIHCSCDVLTPLIKSVRIAALSRSKNIHGK